MIHLAIAALALVPAVASAQAQKPYMIHGGLGYTAALNDGAPSGSLGLQGGVIYRLEGTPEVGIGGEFGYFMLGTNSATVADLFGNYYTEKAKWSTLSLIGEFYYFVSPKISTPYLVGGIGVYPVKLTYSQEAAIGVDYASASVDLSETDFGVNAGLGFLFGQPQSQLRFGADGRFHIVMTEDESWNIIAVMGRIFF
jgi:hypothetical protein